MMNVNPHNRAMILTYAASLLPDEERENPVSVAAAALPLLEWAEAAADHEDLQARMRSMGQQYVNTCTAGVTPGQFVDSAGTLYAFISGGRAEDRPGGLCTPRHRKDRFTMDRPDPGAGTAAPRAERERDAERGREATGLLLASLCQRHAGHGREEQAIDPAVIEADHS